METATFWVVGFLALFSVISTQAGKQKNSETMDFTPYLPLKAELLDRLLDTNDGPFEKQIKKLVADFLLANAVEQASNNSSNNTSLENKGRALIQQQPQIVYVYGTPPSTQRTRRPPRTRRPSHHHQSHESSEERRRTTQQPIIQPVYIQQPVYQPQYQPQPPYNPQYQPAKQQPTPQDSIAGSGSTAPAAPAPSPLAPVQSVQQPSAPVPPPRQPQQQPIQVVYIEPSTSPGPPRPTTTRPSQQHVYNQVNKILDNVASGSITGIVDSALGIRTPMPTRNFVNGILSTVFCNPVNRLLGRCRGNGSA